MSSFIILRECLWRVPVAFTAMVEKEEKNRINQERCCKVFSYCLNFEWEKEGHNCISFQFTNTSVSLPSAFTRERNTSKRKGIFRPRSIVVDEFSIPQAANAGFFTQQHTDAKVFMEEHFQARVFKISKHFL